MFSRQSDALWPLISASLAEVEGLAPIQAHHSLSGGSINSAYRVTTEAGETLFVKTNHASNLAMFEAEFDGLKVLAEPGAIRVPRPLVTGSGAGRAWLVTEYVELQQRGSEALLGTQLAALHRHQAERFGWFRDNTIGSTPQLNRQHDDWITFYRDQRLKFQLDLAAANGFAGALQQKGERLLDELGCFFSGYSPAASLLHGDLWGGNCSFDLHGEPVIFDPAVYYGDREADLAMTELFGGFGREFYAAYEHAWPIDGGYGVRKTLYNLYHILNHANLFGGGYAVQAETMIDRLLSEV